MTRSSVLQDPAFIDKYNWNNGEFLDVLNEQLSKHVKPFYRPMTPEFGDVEDATAIGMTQILSGEKSAQKALSEANKALYEIYKEAGYYDK